MSAPSSKKNITTTTSNKKIKTSNTMPMTRNNKNNTNDVHVDGTNNDFRILREYILKCPLLGQNNPAVRAALEGIEKEEKRRIRDAKLRSKFGGIGNSSSSNNNQNQNNKNTNSNSPCLTDGDEIVVVEKDSASDSFILEENNSSNSNNNHDDDDMEWQDVQQQQKDEDAMVPSVRAIGDSFTMEQDEEGTHQDDNCCSFLGKTLSKACIDAIAEQNKTQPVVVSSPLAAIAVALHVSLRSEILGFACTGIPEDTKTTNPKGKKTIGFAPPIRELSRTEFLPRGWDRPNSQQPLASPDRLRYRKMDTGSVVLAIQGRPSNEEGNSTECRVTFAPSKEEDASAHLCLEFPLSEHINLDSWNAAALGNGSNKIAPSLHYKNLSGLLSKFCRTFDLGAVRNDDSEMGGYEPAAAGTIYNTTTGSSSSCSSSSRKPEATASSFVSSIMSSSTMESRSYGYSVPSTLDQAFPPPPGVAAATATRTRNDPRLVDFPPPHHRGDFADDLLPTGLRDPRLGGRPGTGIGGGNLMGPNHPAFGGNVPGNFPGGPGTMQPRFDPIVPPCIGGGVGGGDDPRRRRRGANGEPNPDHLPPPNSLGNNMFS